MEFKNLTDQVAHSGCTGLAQLKDRSQVSRSTRSYDVSNESSRRRGVCLHVAEYGVRSAVETTSAMVKFAFELSLVRDERGRNA